jgi:hypothetical protein
MKTALFKALLVSALMLLLMFACTLALRLYKTIVPEHVERDTRNITAAEVDQALNRWTASGITQYEMRLITKEEEYKLRVDTRAETVEILDHYIGSNLQYGERGMYPLEDYYVLTVPALFDDARLISYLDLGDVGTPDEDGFTKYYDNRVAFDSMYGYPTEVSQYERRTWTSREIVWRTTISKTEIRDFKPLD